MVGTESLSALSVRLGRATTDDGDVNRVTVDVEVENQPLLADASTVGVRRELTAVASPGLLFHFVESGPNPGGFLTWKPREAF